MGDRIPPSLQEATAAIATVLHWPKNLGIEFRPIRLHTQPETDLLAIFVHGLADDELVRSLAIEPLEQVALQRPGIGRLLPDALHGILPAPRIRVVKELSAAIRGVLGGATALFFDGAAEAVLVQTRAPVTRPIGTTVPENPYKEIFGPDLADNVALIRKRLRDPVLVAEPQDLPRGRAGGAAILHLHGRAEPELIGQVRGWLQQRATEEGLHRGLAAGRYGWLGPLPTFISSAWPDKAAVLLDAGYVVALMDRLPYAYIAPVTAPAILYSPGDENLRRPVSGLVRFLRVLLSALVVAGPAFIVALMNYHQELIPTPFLLGLASIRENAGFPVVGEVLGLEALQEVIRAATFHLPSPISPGTALVASAIVAGLLVFGGIVSPLPAVMSLIVTIAILGLPSNDLAYMTRAWRWPMIAGAATFGLFGMAAVGVLFAAYLTQSESFGVSFIGESGLHFTTPGRVSSRHQGGIGHAPKRTVR